MPFSLALLWFLHTQVCTQSQHQSVLVEKAASVFPAKHVALGLSVWIWIYCVSLCLLSSSSPPPPPHLHFCCSGFLFLLCCHTFSCAVRYRRMLIQIRSLTLLSMLPLSSCWTACPWPVPPVFAIICLSLPQPYIIPGKARWELIHKVSCINSAAIREGLI